MYALPFFSYSYKNTWGMPIYQITIRNTPHNNVEEYFFYKNPQTMIQTLPDSVIETLFRLVSTAFPTLKNHPIQTEKETDLLDPGKICLFLSVNQQSLSITIEEDCRWKEPNLILEDLLQKMHAILSPYHLFQFQA